MILQQSLELSRPTYRRVELPHFRGAVIDFIEPPPGPGLPRPQAFLVQQDPHCVLPTHFHQEHQFQLFVGGGASLGQHVVRHLEVHYASPHSAYGPLKADERGLEYLTLRAVSDQGAWILPNKRSDLLLRIPKMQKHAAPQRTADTQALLQLGAPEQETLIAPEPGGPGAWIMRLPPKASGLAPAPSPGSAGRFHVLTCGQASTSEGDLEALAVIWSGPGEEVQIQAGPKGAEVVVMEYPQQAARSFVKDMNLNAVPY
ncbi:MAG: hypothetical protein WCK08_09580 [Betaproteobacteria bacterium]